jgi:hypothetical protein
MKSMTPCLWAVCEVDRAGNGLCINYQQLFKIITLSIDGALTKVDKTGGRMNSSLVDCAQTIVMCLVLIIFLSKFISSEGC